MRLNVPVQKQKRKSKQNNVRIYEQKKKREKSEKLHTSIKRSKTLVVKTPGCKKH